MAATEYNLMTPTTWEKLDVLSRREALHEALAKSRVLQQPVTVVSRCAAERKTMIVGTVYPTGIYIDVYNRQSTVDKEY